MLWLQALGLSISLHLNPELKISEFPLESFYRYVVDLVPLFDDSGNSASRQTDHAIFSSLRTPQVLTLHIDAPEPWLVEVTEALYDMDNIKLEELGEKRTLTARYELASLLITGATHPRQLPSPLNCHHPSAAIIPQLPSPLNCRHPSTPITPQLPSPLRRPVLRLPCRPRATLRLM